ncbi:MAG TPA: hypothetical protein VK797_09520 [Tepidisphaeraceae bacterium]|jgi:hypothetical protein|nr:hypothetical protein [Tepidisphaeraceae bacterium]
MQTPNPVTLLFLAALPALSCMMGGCSHAVSPKPDDEVTANVDRNLRLVDSGTNKKLKFKADHAGLIRLYDVQKGEYLYNGELKAGDQFALEPVADHAMINKEPAYLEHATNRYDEYQLYFLNQ